MLNQADILYEGRISASYFQVALFDAHVKGSYPEWKTGKERIVVGPRGIVVALETDAEVEVVACRGVGEPEAFELCVSAEIVVGDSGVLIGNVPSGNTKHLDWPPGNAVVVVYTSTTSPATSKVYFFLSSGSL